MAKIAVIVVLISAAIVFGVITVQGFDKSEKLEDKIESSTLEAENAAIKFIDACIGAKTDQDWQTCTEGMKDVLELCKTDSQTFDRVCGTGKMNIFMNLLEKRQKSSYTLESENPLDTQSTEQKDSSALAIAESEFNEKSLTVLDLCSITISPSDIESCKVTVSKIKEQCTDPRSAHLSVCNDSRINTILSRNIEDISDLL